MFIENSRARNHTIDIRLKPLAALRQRSKGCMRTLRLDFLLRTYMHAYMHAYMHTIVIMLTPSMIIMHTCMHTCMHA